MSTKINHCIKYPNEINQSITLQVKETSQPQLQHNTFKIQVSLPTTLALHW